MDRQIRQVKDFADNTYFQYVAEAKRSKEADDAKLQEVENNLAASIQEVSVVKKTLRDASGFHATEQRRLSYELSAAQVQLQRLNYELSASETQKSTSKHSCLIPPVSFEGGRACLRTPMRSKRSLTSRIERLQTNI